MQSLLTEIHNLTDVYDRINSLLDGQADLLDDDGEVTNQAAWDSYQSQLDQMRQAATKLDRAREIEFFRTNPDYND